MRPVTRGASPQPGVAFTDHKKAAPHLKDAIGEYCSYCERYQSAGLHVEHVQPQKLYPGEYGEWRNYLLSCDVCNGTKTDKDVTLDNVLLPDRDNTFVAFRYTLGGKVEPAAGLDPAQQQLALDTIELTGLNVEKGEVVNRNGQLIRFDRVTNRWQTRMMAEDALRNVEGSPTPLNKRCTAVSAAARGGFSIWMEVFKQRVDMRRLLIKWFKGTALDCFDPVTTEPVSPRPPVTGLAHSGKV